MRREHFTLDVSNVDWIDTDGDPAKPSVSIDFTGPASTLRDRLVASDGDPLSAGAVDVTLRLRGSIDSDEPGVVSVANRVTGEFVLELNADAATVLRSIRAARRYGEYAPDEEGRYAVSISLDGDPFIAYDKRTFLVYDDAGNLLRQHSLIPGGVEL